MTIDSYIKRMIAAAVVCLVIAASAGLYLAAKGSNGDRDQARPFVNTARVAVSDIMVELERDESLGLYHEDTSLRLASMAERQGVSLTVALLDGTVAFSTEVSAPRIDLRSTLHYDWYASKAEPNVSRIAFPIIGETSGLQTGHAIFGFPSDILHSNKEVDTASVVAIASMLMASLGVLTVLLFLHRRMRDGALKPVQTLKVHAEAILNGDYSRKAEHVEVDEIGELYAVFDQMRLELEHYQRSRNKHERAQKELVSNISHDLKTPLTTVRTYIEAIRAGVCPDMPAVMAYMDVIHTATDKMALLIDDLLVHALKELGQIAVRPVEQYSGELFTRMLPPIAHYASLSGVVFTGPSSVPNVLIKADAVRLEQVVSNLIANALKHTKAGDEIVVDVCEARRDDRNWLELTVEDNGEGIDPQDMPFIFERYYQGRSGLSREGEGLGLSICKHIIEAHGGEITFRSRKGEGTVFRFAIPLC
ncbi:ATP-binding protein [Paenibacillus sp. NPDC058071]|uniref:sensor histidine kinase n=1 Tax=Paenibacillus sp. NPDC058071 TaxID=3346326 RepID=UPI0036D8A19D